MVESKKLRNRIVSAVMALVMTLAYMPLPIPILVNAAESVNEASVTTAGIGGQPGVTTEYATLGAAVIAANASEGSTIKLLKNMTTQESYSISGTNITLDMNGYALTSSGEEMDIFQVQGTVTVKSSVDGGELISTNSIWGVFYVYPEATLTIESGTIKNTYVSDETTTAALVNDGGTVIINGGSVIGPTYGIVHYNGKVVVNDGYIYSEDEAINASGSVTESARELEINGGNINGNINGICSSGNNGTCTVIISGGYIRGDLEYGIRNLSGATVTIKGGMFYGTSGVIYDESSGIVLGDGFSWIGENGEKLDSVDGISSAFVAVAGDYAAYVCKSDATTGYATVAGAFEGAGDDKATIIVIKSETLTSSITVAEEQVCSIESSVTLTLSGGATLTNDGVINNNNTINGTIVNTENGVFNNNGTVGDITNAGAIYANVYGNQLGSITNSGVLNISGSTITGSITVNASSEEDLALSIEECYFPNGLTVKGTIGDRATTIADILPHNGLVEDSAGNEIVIVEGQTSVDGAVYISLKKLVKVMASGGEESFSSIFEAFENAYYYEKSTVILLEDITVDRSIYVEVDTACNMVLDLNGKKLTYVENGNYSYEVLDLDMYDYAKFTVKSSVTGGVIDGSEAYYAIGVYGGDNCAAIIESGTIKGGEYGGIENRNTLIVNGGVIDGCCAAIDNYGTMTVNGGMFDYTGISDGSVTCSTLYNEGTAIVTGGTFNDADTIWNCGGDMYVLGGSYPNGLAVVEEGVLVDVLGKDSKIYKAANDENVTLEQNQTRVADAVYVKAPEVVSVTDEDGDVKMFTSLQQAFDYAKDMKGVTIQLLDDITVAESTVVNGTGDIVFDLNGKTLTYTDNMEYAIVVIDYNKEEAMLTIKSSIEGGTIDATLAQKAAIRNYSSRLLVMESGTVMGSDYGVYNSESVIINGGKIKAESRALYNYDDDMIVNGGVIEGRVYNRDNLIINGGTFSANTSYSNYALYNKENTTIINGGTFDGDIYTYESLIINGGAYLYDQQGAQLDVYGDLTINGGVFKGVDGHIRPFYNSEYSSDPSVLIAGGEFQQGIHIDSTGVDNTVTIKGVMAGGCYPVDSTGAKITYEDSATSIAGMVKIQNSANNVSVTTVEGEISYFAELGQALYEASKNPGSTVTLLEDITTTASTTVYGGDFTFDINGKMYTVNDNDNDEVIKFIDSKVTIKDSASGGLIDNSTTLRDAIGVFRGSVTIESGAISGGYSAVWNDNGTLVINGGTFTGVKAAIDNEGDLIINDGTFQYTGTEDDYAVIHNDISVTINGGIFKGAITINDYVYESDEVNVIVTGGRFDGGIVIESYNGGTTTIQNMLAEGYGYYKEDGTLVILEDDQETIEHTVIVGIVEPEIVYGDSDGDGEVKVADAVVIKKYLAGVMDTGISMYCADVNADGIVDTKDAVKLMKHLAGYTDEILGEA